MTGLHETSDPKYTAQIDTVGWIFVAVAVAITVIAAVVAYISEWLWLLGSRYDAQFASRSDCRSDGCPRVHICHGPDHRDHKQTNSAVIRARMPVKTAFLVLGDARIPPSPCGSTRKL
jgi:hypothetical protein